MSNVSSIVASGTTLLVYACVTRYEVNFFYAKTRIENEAAFDATLLQRKSTLTGRNSAVVALSILRESGPHVPNELSDKAARH